jgi:hypothetical protein
MEIGITIMLALNIFSTTNGHSRLLNFYLFILNLVVRELIFVSNRLVAIPIFMCWDTPGVLPPKIPDTKVCSNSIQDVHLILSIQ